MLYGVYDIVLSHETKFWVWRHKDINIMSDGVDLYSILYCINILAQIKFSFTDYILNISLRVFMLKGSDDGGHCWRHGFGSRSRNFTFLFEEIFLSHKMTILSGKMSILSDNTNDNLVRQNQALLMNLLVNCFVFL